MRPLVVFNHVTLDGYFTDARGDMSWAHRADPESLAFAAENAQRGAGPLLFGRVTYQMMAAFWPTPAARAMDAGIAKGMNDRPKIVASRTLEEASWSNSRLVRDDLVGTVRALKSEAGEPIVILGSGTLVSQLAAAGLIDEYQLMLNPLALGGGRTLFQGMKDRLALRLTATRPFRNGNILLTYAPA